MPIDCETDTLIPVQALCRERLGKRVAPATLWRWVRKGCRGVRLDAVRAAGTWCTTRAAFAQFLRDQTAAALTTDEVEDHVSERSAAIERRLKAAGLL